jgi:hypothetical protein
VNEAAFAVSGAAGTPVPVIAIKGGLNSIALGGNHDERHFGQLWLQMKRSAQMFSLELFLRIETHPKSFE